MKKRMMSMALCLCMALSLAVPAGAVVETDDSDVPATRHFIIENEEVREISEEEYIELTTPKEIVIENTEDDQIMPLLDKFYSYTIKSSSTYYGTKTAVSPWTAYPTAPNASKSYSTSSTHSRSLSATVTAKIRDSINASLNLSVGESCTSGKTSSAGANAPAKQGYYARIMFQQKMLSVTGTVKESIQYNNGWKDNVFDVKSTYPVLLSNGIGNGIFSVEYSKTPY